MANETKSQLRDALLAHGLPVAWAEWATRMQFEAERPNTIHYESHRPEPPKRTVTAWDDDGDPREYTRTDVEMVEAWEEYQRELNDWREKHGDAATVTKSAPGGPTHYRIELSCPGVTLDLIATRAEGPWRADRLSGYWVPDVLKPVEAVVGAWFGPDGAMKTDTVNATRCQVPGFSAECTFAVAEAREPPEQSDPETTADFLDGMAEDARKRAAKWYEYQEGYFAAKLSPDEDHVYADAMAHAAGMRARNEERVASYLAERAKDGKP